MRIGLGQIPGPGSEYLKFAAQFGVTDVVVNQAKLPVIDGSWQISDLVKLRLAVENQGLKLSALENVPLTMMSDVYLGGPKRDELIENMITTVRNIARAGIPIFGYGWNPSQVWRTPSRSIRGGAMATAYDHSLVADYPPVHGREYGADEMWENLEYWIRAITPVAEEEGIRLGFHPPDPPTDSHGGLFPVLNSYEGYRRLLDIVDSPSNAIEFCQGTISEMTDSANDAIYGFIDEMVRRDRVLYVHFRNVSEPNPESFSEEFINTGHVDMYRAMKTYHDGGYKSFFIDDHVPHTHGDTPWGHRGRAFAMGYMQALIEAISKQG